uniref:Secreted protein n=1 Tax=Angiostrongylus cantonensis TaxID=6313 RepID=A0A0K0D0R1_ANGCA
LLELMLTMHARLFVILLIIYFSEESECRSGLVQERISCVNLLHYACQFVNPSFTFRLVPARITVEEARQAETGAEKCRKVVRLVKKRLEG